MTKGSAFELHSFARHSQAGDDADGGDDWMCELHQQDEPLRSQSVLGFLSDESKPDHAVQVAVDKKTNCPCRARGRQASVASFSVIKRRLGPALCMTAHHRGVLVNGLPALGLTVLLPRDSVVLTPGIHSYVTERIRPYVGAPPRELIGQKCPFCRIPVTADTQIVTCRCGVVYHRETEKSRPAIAEKDRLNCLSKVRVCLSCSRPVTLDEYLVWDPGTL